jgi:hypothetical protein
VPDVVGTVSVTVAVDDTWDVVGGTDVVAEVVTAAVDADVFGTVSVTVVVGDT